MMPQLSAESCRSRIRSGPTARFLGRIGLSGIICLPPLCLWRHAMLPAPHLDSKRAALAAYGAINPHPEAITDPLFATSAFLDAHDLVQTRYEMVRRVQVEGQAVSHVAATFGVSRQTV